MKKKPVKGKCNKVLKQCDHYSPKCTCAKCVNVRKMLKPMTPTKCHYCKGAGRREDKAGFNIKCLACNGTGKTPPIECKHEFDDEVCYKCGKVRGKTPTQSKHKFAQAGGMSICQKCGSDDESKPCKPKTSECTCGTEVPCNVNSMTKSQPTERTLERLSNPQCIEDVLMQVGAYGAGDSKYIAQAIKEFIAGKLPSPEQLHIWYLEATSEIHNMNFNPNAHKPYSELNEEQKFIDKYISDKIKSALGVDKGT